MGGAISAGADNNELVDNLVAAEYIKSPEIEKVFKAVDRGDYYLEDHKENAYKDLAWKHGNIHISAPHIYAKVVELLQVEPGMRFLNLGSGTGYLNTMIGLLLGPYGVNHGVEYHSDVVDYARERLESCLTGESFDASQFSPPLFVQGNCLHLSPFPFSGRYDRVYCGAACPPEQEDYMKGLVKVGGILVLPLNEQLQQMTRVSETSWETISVMPVCFPPLISSSCSISREEKEEDIKFVSLPHPQPLTLQHLSRLSIRHILRRSVDLEHPPTPPPSPPSPHPQTAPPPHPVPLHRTSSSSSTTSHTQRRPSGLTFLSYPFLGDSDEEEEGEDLFSEGCHHSEGERRRVVSNSDMVESTSSENMKTVVDSTQHLRGAWDQTTQHLRVAREQTVVKKKKVPTATLR